MLNETFLPWLAIVLAILSFVGIFMMLSLVRKHQQQQTQLQLQLKQLQEQIQQPSEPDTLGLENDIQEVRSGAIVLGRRVQAIEAQIVELAEQQPNPDDLEPERRLYSRAVRMVELGADLDEIMRECELPRAEAELLFSLHQQKSAR
ncbi:hypothetical protein GCM10011369_20230 [Neiella marina]|uniref:DUF2802 domain-containing protein n=1 Tax=Neiella marina TaxID=508461 RepID=A0A8J2U5A9_9GAMM|nr:DUF2802 domain-containing protein [Neiella marina]GGA78263.1 hypothetical protein GCM10011369_20230 [Neiella marina]